jgi:hypothetical protein
MLLIVRFWSAMIAVPSVVAGGIEAKALSRIAGPPDAAATADRVIF